LAYAASGEARLEVAGDAPPVPQLHAGERAVLVREVGHRGQVARVVLVPQAGGDQRPGIAGGMNRAELGVDCRPASLRLHPPDVRLSARQVRPEARAVRALVEAVAQCPRTDTDRLEKDVVTGIPGHQR